VTTRLPGIRAISIATGAALVLGLPVATAAAADAAATPRALVVKHGLGTNGVRSVRVRAVQHALQRHGFRVHRADGRFGRATRLAVRGAHDVRRRIPGATPGLPPLRRGRGAS
jgi:peptidoglycan hydrolase-like protein with peptidoglycan-binding domain